MIIMAHLVATAALVWLVCWMRFTEDGRKLVAFLWPNWRDVAVGVFGTVVILAIAWAVLAVAFYWGGVLAGGK